MHETTYINEADKRRNKDLDEMQRKVWSYL